MPEWLCTWAILGAKVTTSKSIVFAAKDRPTAPFLQGSSGVRTFLKVVLPPDSSFSYEYFVHIRGNKGGGARGDATICEEVWGSHMWSSKLYFSTEFSKNVLKILCSMGVKFTMNLETFWSENTRYFQFGDRIRAKICGAVSYEDHIRWSQKWIHILNVSTVGVKINN